MSYAEGVEEAVSALGGSSWSRVNAGGNYMMRKCGLDSKGHIKNLPEGGVAVIPSGEAVGHLL